MRDWALTSRDPYTLRIAADARMSQPRYTDDQIWEACLEGGEPPALALETTYGLRARSMRIFPAFHLGEQFRMAPDSFQGQPTVCRALTNYLRIELSPFERILVIAEYWIPDSESVAGRIMLHNSRPEPVEIRTLIHALLRPDESGAAMTAVSRQGVTILAGRTGNLAPVVFLAGGAVQAVSAHPALRVQGSIDAGGTETLLWAQAATETLEESFDKARETAAVNWDGQIARLELINASLLEVETGDQGWDVAFSMAQKVSLSSYLAPTSHLPHASVVASRTPDRGVSLRGGGRDHHWTWEGQSAGLAFLNALQVLPAAPELAKGLVLNFLSAQAPDGSIDMKPGLGGQRKGVLCAPLLASLAWRIYEWTEDAVFLEAVAPGLERFLARWFDPKRDRDQDGHPEWDHIFQAGFDDWPTFMRWEPWGGGLDITLAETPDLAAYLVREHDSLIAMCRALGRSEPISDLAGRASRLTRALRRSHSGSPPAYRHLDRELHLSMAGERLGIQRGEYRLALRRTLDPPARVQVRVRGEERPRSAFQVSIRGRSVSPRRLRVERLKNQSFEWHLGLGNATSQIAYADIEAIEVRGLSDEFTTELGLADYSRLDQASLLPLWSGVPDPDMASRLVEQILLAPNHFWRQHGIPSCSAQDPAYASDSGEGTATVWMLANLMLGEGLVDYGYLPQAAELVGRLVVACKGALTREKCFREGYHPDSDQTMGARDHAGGVAPLSLFLYVLGVKLISPRKVMLRGLNPFPWPIRMRWQGIEINWNKSAAIVRFADGAEVRVVGDQPQVVEQDPEPGRPIAEGSSE